jgi:4-amino-4-deoxy-L-arabinose transferase-like glycosyltransferase
MPEAASPSANAAAAPNSPGFHAADIALLLGLCFVLFFWGLGSVPLYNKGEPREGLVVWDIWSAGNWILPLRGGVDIPSKPPMFHWIAALAAIVSGSLNEFTLRFPSALLGAVGVLLVYLTGAALWGRVAGLVSAIVLATSFEWWRAATTARVDMTLTFFMLASFLCFYYLYQSRGGLLKSLLMATLLGLATLAKGPVGAILPCLAGLVFLACKRDFAFLKKIHLPIAVPVGIAVAATWYVLALWEGGEKFFARQIVHEIIMTPLGGAGHNQPFYYYLPKLLAGLAPWSLFLPSLAIFLYRQRRRLDEERLLYLVICFAAVFIAASLSIGKRPVYILPLYPAVALLLGAWWQKLSEGSVPRAGVAKAAAVFAAVALLLLATALTVQLAGWNLLELVGSRLDRRSRELLPLVAQVLDTNRPAVAALAALFGIPALFALVALRRAAWRGCFAALATVMVGFYFLLQTTVHPAFADKLAPKSFMLRAKERIGEQAPLVIYRAGGFSAGFYRRLLFNARDIDVATAQPPFFLLTQEAEWQRLREIAGVTLVEPGDPIVPAKLRLVLIAVGEGARVELKDSKDEDSSADSDE